MAFLYYGFCVARKLQDTYSAFLVYGLTLLISVQGLINIAMVIGCFPVTGIPLPFISFGGTSLLVNMAALGLIWGTSTQSLKDYDEQERKKRIAAMCLLQGDVEAAEKYTGMLQQENPFDGDCCMLRIRAKALVRDGSAMPPVGIFISALVSLLFALLAAFAWTSEVKNVRFMMIRKTVMIIVLLTIFALKLRLVNRVMALLDFSKTQNVLYVAAYFLTLAALLILFVYYAFILRNLPLHPKMSVILPVAVIIGFVGCVVCEALLFFGFGFGLEASPLRTLVIRPVFYLGFIGLCVYFLFPPPLMEDQIDYYT